MSTSLRALAAVALLMGTTASLVAPAAAAPIGQPLTVAKSAPDLAEQVYWRGRGWGWGGAVVGGLAAGAILGAAAAPYYYGPGYGYYYPPGYYAEPAYGPPPPSGGDESYCMQRYRSYDPNTGTFLGKDGRRHPCP